MSSLKVGHAAPMFEAVDAHGDIIDLSTMDDSFVLLAFMRYAGCPWCNLTIHRLALEYPLLRKNGCKVIAVVQSSVENVRQNIYERHEHRPEFPIIPDHSRKLYDLYDVQPSLMAAPRSVPDVPYWLTAVFKHGFKQTEIDGNLLMVPAMFLIAPRTQELLVAEYGRSFYEHSTFTGVYDALTFERV